MASRGSQRERDLDDWFDETDLAPRRPRRPVARDPASAPTFEGVQADDDWLDREGVPEEAFARPGRFDLRDPRLWAALGAVVVLLAVGLYVGGVFNGTKHKPPAITTLSQTPTTPAQTGTTTKTVTPPTKQLALPTTALKPGDTGAQVKKLQRALATLGYAPGVIDGRYGPATEKALMHFQKAKKLTSDGVLGPKTLAALRKAAG